VNVIKDENTGEVTEIHCTYDPATRGGDAPDGRKVKSTLHWVSAAHACNAEVRLYDRLFNKPYPDEVDGGGDFINFLNPDSYEILNNCYLEPGLKKAKLNEHYQFERLGYFYLDKDSSSENLIFNQTVALRNPWAKFEKTIRREQETN